MYTKGQVLYPWNLILIHPVMKLHYNPILHVKELGFKQVVELDQSVVSDRVEFRLSLC